MSSYPSSYPANPNAPPPPPPKSDQYPDPPSYFTSTNACNQPPGAFPQTGYSAGAYPQGGTYPAAGYPQAGYPQAGYPQAGYPQAEYPQAGYPQTGFAQTGYTPGYAGQGVTTGGSNLPQYQSHMSDTSDTDQVEVLGGWKGFTDKAIRRAFIRKVYIILMLQLSFTVATIALFVFHQGVNEFVRRNIALYIAAYVSFLVLYFMLLCCGNLRRNYPTNYILLLLFTLVMSYLVATISSFHETKAVLIAMGICASCCLGITLFSFQTKYDFTQWGGILFVLSWVLLMFGIIAALTFRSVPILHTIYAALGALLFMGFLAYDTQMLMGGKKYQLSAEEHVFAALQLYMDVVQIFLFILALVGGGKKG